MTQQFFRAIQRGYNTDLAKCAKQIKTIHNSQSILSQCWLKDRSFPLKILGVNSCIYRIFRVKSLFPSCLLIWPISIMFDGRCGQLWATHWLWLTASTWWNSVVNKSWPTCTYSTCIVPTIGANEAFPSISINGMSSCVLQNRIPQGNKHQNMSPHLLSAESLPAQVHVPTPRIVVDAVSVWGSELAPFNLMLIPVRCWTRSNLPQAAEGIHTYEDHTHKHTDIQWHKHSVCTYRDVYIIYIY